MEPQGTVLKGRNTKDSFVLFISLYIFISNQIGSLFVIKKINVIFKNHMSY